MFSEITQWIKPEIDYAEYIFLTIMREVYDRTIFISHTFSNTKLPVEVQYTTNNNTYSTEGEDLDETRRTALKNMLRNKDFIDGLRTKEDQKKLMPKVGPKLKKYICVPNV